MAKNFLEFDASKPEYEREGADIIKIVICNDKENHVNLNFTNFFIKSRYIRDKYSYTDGIVQIQSEFDSVCQAHHIMAESVRLFVSLIDSEKGRIPIERYSDICKRVLQHR